MSKVAFAADIHDHAPFIDHLLATFADRGVETVVVLGDITTPKTLAEFSDFDVHLVLGNADEWRDLIKQAESLEATVHGWSGLLTFGDATMFVRHGHHGERGLSYAMAAHQADYAFHGHYHYQETTEVGSGLVVNPGADGCAIYDTETDSLELITYDAIDPDRSETDDD